MKGNNSDGLRKSCELRSDESVRKAAEEKQDSRMLAVTSREIESQGQCKL